MKIKKSILSLVCFYLLFSETAFCETISPKELILDTKQNVNQLSENANNTINNMNVAVNNLNNILEEFQTDAGFKRMIKLYLRADREFKREK